MSRASAGVSSILNSVSELEELFGYEEISPLHVDIKSFFCCDISNFLYTIWKDLMLTGIARLWLLFALNMLIARRRFALSMCSRMHCTAQN